MIVRARHASTLRHVPRGGRNVRLDVVSTRIDAEIGELPASDFAPVPLNPTLRVLGDHVWEELGAKRPDGGHEPFGVPLFLDALAGDVAPDSEAARVFEGEFAQTPLVASTWGLQHPYQIVRKVTRGDPREPKSREIVRDGRDRSAAAAVEFLRREVAVVGDRVLVRRHPLATWRVEGIQMVMDVELAPHGKAPKQYPFDIGRRAEVLVGYHEKGTVRVGDGPAAILDVLGANPEPGREALYFASVLPGAAIAAVDSAKAKGITQFSDEMADIYERLHPYADAGAVGALNLDEVEPALDLVEDIAWRLINVNVSAGPFDWHRVDGYFQRGRIGRLPRSAEDEADLGDLVP